MPATERVIGQWSFGYDRLHLVTPAAEGRVCASGNGSYGVQYIYDAEGNRVAKGTISRWSCDTTSNGFIQTAGYVVGPSGEQMTEINGAGQWVHTNAYAGGKLIGTYDTAGLHFYIDDPLGTRRVQINAVGIVENSFLGLPFGDRLASSNQNDPTENHFTGKERDTESGNDDFGARYYNSATGRFLSPDWSAKIEPVPYVKLGDPQTLNLYAYVGNNPVDRIDLDGHFAGDHGVFDQIEGFNASMQAADAASKQQAQQQMTTSAAGKAFIAGWEGWNGTVDKKTGLTFAKDDGFGNGTIGWGHNCGKCADFAGGITKAQGDSLLTQDLGRFEGAVNGLGANLSQQQFDGLVSFAFNVRNSGGSTLFSNVASGAAVTEGNFTAYGHARVNGQLVAVPGLMRRRESEYNVYANGVYDSSH